MAECSGTAWGQSEMDAYWQAEEAVLHTLELVRLGNNLGIEGASEEKSQMSWRQGTTGLRRAGQETVAKVPSAQEFICLLTCPLFLHSSLLPSE